MIKAILFDLDGTLLPMDLDVFLGIYMDDVAAYTKDMCGVDEMKKAIIAAALSVRDDLDPSTTNQQVFDAAFTKALGRPMEEFRQRFDEFYTNEFRKIGAHLSYEPMSARIVEAAKQKGFRLVVATSPLFPRSATVDRLIWARVNPEDFELITTYEIMHASKPNISYYEELLNMIGLDATECLMVGNDVQEDMIVLSMGMQAFYVKNHFINRTDAEPDCASGNYEDLYKFIQSL